MLNQQEMSGRICLLLKRLLFPEKDVLVSEIAEKLDKLWSIEVRSVPWFHQIWEDLNDYLEHYPASKKRRISHILFLDYIILTYNKECEESLECRNDVLKHFPLSNQQLENRVKNYFFAQTDEIRS